MNLHGNLLRVAVAGWFAVFMANLAAPLMAANLPDDIRVVEIQGVVEVSPAGADTWVLTQTNQTLHAADRLRTGANSRAALKWSDQSVMQLGPLTELEILPHPTDEEPGLHLLQGILSFFHRDKPGRIRIITRGVTAGIDGTEFVLEVTGAGAASRTALWVIDGQVGLTNDVASVAVTNGVQAISVPGRAPILTRGFIANNLLQWCFYYPAVLDLKDLPLSATEETALAPSLADYRAGDVAGALAKYPNDRAAQSDNARVYRAALLLAVGEAAGAEGIIDSLSGPDASSRARRLGNALRLLIAAVKRQTVTAAVAPELPTELLAASYYEQSRGQGDQSLNTALSLAEKAAARSPGFSFAWERVAELEFGFGRTSAARAALRKSLDLAPRNAQAVALDGFLSSAQNRMSEALAAFNRAIILDGALGNAWLGRGLCRIKLGQKQSGREDLLIAAALEPQRSLLRSYLGKAFADNGDDARATRELKLARALDPNDPTAWLYSALLKQQENQINQAISDLQNAQTNNDNRSVFRSRLLLDKDFAVASANLASFYLD
jgi:Tfp pilus assembly protein PilF